MIYQKINKKSLVYTRLNFFMEVPTGFEPAIRQLQCLALPLGYRTIIAKMIIPINYTKVNKNLWKFKKINMIIINSFLLIFNYKILKIKHFKYSCSSDCNRAGWSGAWILKSKNWTLRLASLAASLIICINKSGVICWLHEKVSK